MIKLKDQACIMYRDVMNPKDTTPYVITSTKV